MFIKYIWLTEKTVQVTEGPITVVTDQVIEVYNDDYNELRQRYPWEWVLEEHGSNPVGLATTVNIGPTVAVVAKNGDDATGLVWDASKPFLTPEAADAATPLLGTVIIYPWSYTVTLNAVIKSIILIDAQLGWTITANRLFISWVHRSTSLVGLWSTVTATITANRLAIDSLFQLSWQLNISSWDSYYSNIYRWISPWDLLPGFDWTAIHTRPFISNIWSIQCSLWTVLPSIFWTSWFSTDALIFNVWEIFCQTLMSGIDDTNTTIRFSNLWRVNCSSDVFQCAPNAAGRPTIELNSCNIKAAGHIVNWSWGVWPWITLRVMWGTVLDSAQTENVVWTWSPAGKVEVMAPRSASRVSWDWGSWVVNDLLGDTLVNWAITLW